MMIVITYVDRGGFDRYIAAEDRSALLQQVQQCAVDMAPGYADFVREAAAARYAVLDTRAAGRPYYGIVGDNVIARELSANRGEVEALANLLNRGQASELHFYEIIEDWFGRP
ncbi:hypothetical protein [Intestinibacillus massiliensis]|uniref:hypothetical protein n=1 Tax=Intestinibacillus massiliensis TaxID=1871029 RepID=UPI00117AA4A0|nr:hypothetical protein [Intestinibacillus massiliensis]